METHNKKKGLRTSNCFYDKSDVEKNHIATSHTVTTEKLDVTSVLGLHLMSQQGSMTYCGSSSSLRILVHPRKKFS